ncbi:MAG: septation ring formation regulator [Erysipelotrichaceae bacterium]|nr:MAG: septation ring formation regulator [Erysipelotrichaceae bacterium]
MSWQAFIDSFRSKEMQLFVLVLGLILFTFILFFLLRKLNLRKRLHAVETKYTAIKGLPLPFKVNKALALAKVRDEVFILANDFKNDFDAIQDRYKSIAQVLGECEDELLTNHLKDCRLDLEHLEEAIIKLDQDARNLDTKLDEILKEENHQRSQITELKEQFRNVKNSLNQRNAQLTISWPVILEKIDDLEHVFVIFEEWLMASEFTKAQEKVVEIEAGLMELNTLNNVLPDLIQLAKGIIPKQIDEIAQLYTELKNDKVYLVHLEVKKNIEMVTNTTKEDIVSLSRCVYKDIQEHLKDNNLRLTQLFDQLKKEKQAHLELKNAFVSLHDKLKATQSLFDALLALSKKESKRLGVNTLVEALTTHEVHLQRATEDKLRVVRLFDERSVPESSVLVSCKEILQDLGSLYELLSHQKDSITSAKNDEDRAKKQLLKLYLIMNEVQVKIRKYKLPNISSTYEGDINRAYGLISSIDKLLDEVPLNIVMLNNTVNDAIDVVYRLYNNVNNLVGTVEMIENTIVFANKYRVYSPEMDAQLTRAELLFRNGDYTQAIKVALNAAEKIQPINYDELIKENSKSAQS